MYKFIKGFSYAFTGLAYTFRTQLNFRVHLILLVLVLGTGYLFKLSQTEWLSICLVSGLVLCAEMLNTAIELLVDLISPEYNEKAGRIKDIAAGAVLIAACTALCTAGLIFIPKILNYAA